MKKFFRRFGFPLLLLAVVATFVGASFFLDCLGPSSVLNKYSNTINSLFSGLAFAALIYTIIQQREDLDLQRQQIELSIVEQRAANAEFTRQNLNIELQRFENTFFKMIDNQSRLYLSLRYQFSSTTYEKSHLIVFLNDYFLNNQYGDFENALKELSNSKISMITYDRIVENYNSVNNAIAISVMEPYIRSIKGSFNFLILNKEFLGDRFLYYLLYFKLQISDEILLYLVCYEVFRRDSKVSFIDMLTQFDFQSVFNQDEDSSKVILQLYHNKVAEKLKL